MTDGSPSRMEADWMVPDRQPRSRVRAWMVACGLVVVALGWVAVPVFVPRQAAPEVMSTQPDMWAGGSADVWAAWLDTDDDVQDLWARAGGRGDPPALDGSAALFVGVAHSSCPVTATRIDLEPPQVRVVVSKTRGSFVGCGDVLNVTTFMIGVDPEQVRPPLTVEVADVTLDLQRAGQRQRGDQRRGPTDP